MALPDNIHETQGAPCVAAHARESKRGQCTDALTSRLAGERLDGTRSAIRARMGRPVPGAFPW